MGHGTVPNNRTKLCYATRRAARVTVSPDGVGLARLGLHPFAASIRGCYGATAAGTAGLTAAGVEILSKLKRVTRKGRSCEDSNRMECTLARKTIFVSDLTGKEIGDKNAATVIIKYADARRGQVVLDVNAAEVDDLASKGTKQARRGRRPKTAP